MAQQIQKLTGDCVKCNLAVTLTGGRIDAHPDLTVKWNRDHNTGRITGWQNCKGVGLLPHVEQPSDGKTAVRRTTRKPRQTQED